MAIDQAGLVSLQNLLSSQGAKWTAGQTPLVGLSNQELRLRLGYTPGQGELSLQERESRGAQQLQAHGIAAAAGAPTGFDWRNVNGKNFISSVKDQANCGSCVDFGTCATLDATIRILRQLPVNDPYGAVLTDLSEAQLFYCGNTNPNSCHDGWNVSAALDYCHNHGISPEYSFPYNPGHPPCALSPNASETNTVLQASHWITNVQDMKNWLSTHGPLVACFTVYDDFFAYKSGVYHYNGHAPVASGHCVCCVGYDDTKQAWLCKNSWGTGWGEGGFFWIGYGQCGIDASMAAADSFSAMYPAAGTVFYLQSALSQPGKLLVADISGGNPAPSTQVLTWSEKTSGANNQLWTMTPDGHILSLLNGFVLDVGGGKPVLSAGIVAYPQNTPPTPNQKWTMTPDGHLQSGLLYNGQPLVLDVADNNPAPGTKLVVWTKKQPATPNQLWKLVHVK